MYYEMLNFLMEKKYVDLFHWANKIIEQHSNKVSEEQKNILLPLKDKNIEAFMEIIRKNSYITIHNDSLKLILEHLEKFKEEIQIQWNFLAKFSSERDKKYLNIILNEDILVFQENILNIKKKNLKNKKDFSLIIQKLQEEFSNTSHIMFNARKYKARGISSINNLQAVYNNSEVKDELNRYNKYEQIVQFIEKLDEKLQKLFSENQIGVIIYQSKVYIIKWVQFLTEEQLLTGKIKNQGEVSVYENLGVKIGVELKQNFQLGNLVVFKNRDEELIQERENDFLLEPLLSLNEELFSFKKKKVKSAQKYNLTNLDDCKLFVKNILSRIEMGILLLTKGNQTQVKSSEELDLYVKISLHRVDGMDSINQRLNILRELLSINENPDNHQEIFEKLEHNYLLLLKEMFIAENTFRLLDVIKIINKLDLFHNTIGLLIQTLVYLIDSYYVDSKVILDMVDYLSNNWKLNSGHYKQLEKPQISAITEIVIKKLNQRQFNEVLSYLDDYLNQNTHLGSLNILTLIIEILLEIFRSKYQLENINFTNKQYINFLNQFSLMVISHKNRVTKKEYNELKIKLEQNFTILVKDVKFISYIDDQIDEFIICLQNFGTDIFSDQFVFKIIQALTELIPIVIFHDLKPDLAIKYNSFLITHNKDPKQIIKFFTIYTKYFNQSSDLIRNNHIFFVKVVSILKDFNSLLKTLKIKKIFIIPFKKEIKNLLYNWYIAKNLPENDFEVHKKLISTWIEFADLDEDLKRMHNILNIKDFFWSCNSNILEKMEQKYQDIPKEVFHYNKEDLLNEMIKIIENPFTNLDEFKIIHKTFNYLHMDYDKFSFTLERFELLISKFTNNVVNSILQLISEGLYKKFKNILSYLNDFIIYITKKQFNQISEHFKELHQIGLDEGERFNCRLEMLKILSLEIESFLQRYENVRKEKEKFVSDPIKLIHKEFLEKYYKDLLDSSYDIFEKAQKWFTIVSKNEFLTHEKAYSPMKNLFTSVLIQFSGKKRLNIIEELKDLIKNIFENQTMLNENKKKFFSMMMKVLPEQEYPEFYPELIDCLNFINELSDVEALYYTIQTPNKDKLDALKKRMNALIEEYPHHFKFWFIFGNILALQEDYNEAIKLYNKAFKYEIILPVSNRLYHNLLVSYLSIGKVNKAIEVLKDLDVGIRTNPAIREIVSRIESQTGRNLQENI